MNAFVGKVAMLPSAVGEVMLGTVDASRDPAVADAISRLLFRSIDDARASRGGHLPDWLVRDVENQYISPSKVVSLWAPFGHRFVLVHEGGIVGTVMLTRAHDTIFTVDRHTNNVPSAAHPGFKPDRHHHMVNLSVLHELRRAHLGRTMIDGIVTHFRELFDGLGIWVRADPPWHSGLEGLGFDHDPSMDVFLPPDVERTRGLPHAAFNALHACACRPQAPARPDRLAERGRRMQEGKLQYVSFTRPFDRATSAPRGRPVTTAPTTTDPSVRETFARDWGRVRTVVPEAVAFPRDAEEAAALLREATRTRTPVTVRGQGHTVDGQSLGRGLVLCTERMNVIGAVGTDTVTVAGGVTWRALLETLAPHGLYPPVVPGFPPSSVGGTLSTGGFAKGSHDGGLVVDHVRSLLVVTGDGRLVECGPRQAAWLFDAALGGLGRCGLVAEATLELVPRPARVALERRSVASDADLGHAIQQACAAPETLHVTAFADATWRWSLAVATADPEGNVAFEAYVAPPRPLEPPGPATWLHWFVPADALQAVVARCAATLDVTEGDSVVVLPVRRTADAAARRVVTPGVGEPMFGVCVTRLHAGRDTARLDESSRRLESEAIALGCKRYLAGALPQGDDAWREHFGDDVRRARFDRAARIADPAGILTARR